jgi:tetratricopeptide (TPR) repeat protein
MPLCVDFSPRCVKRNCTIRLVLAVALPLIAIAGARGDDQSAALAAASQDNNDAASASSSPSGENATKQRIEKLVRQLGNPLYSERRAAAAELRQIGPEAFDLLHAATNDVDPEVAASAHYLLQQVTVRWVRNDDSPAVRTLLRDFGSQAENWRTARIAELAKLPNGEGAAGLCRVARYDQSPLVSRTAALAIIQPSKRSPATSQLDSEIVALELGESTRESAVWIRRYLAQLRDPAASADYWEKLVEQETTRLQQNAEDTSAEIVLGLLWNLSEIYRQVDQQQPLLNTLDRMLTLNDDSAQQVGAELVEWLLKHKNFNVLDEFLTKNQTSFEQNKRLLYYAAMARAQQKKTELAEQLAEKAALMDPQTGLESFIAAKDLEEHSQFEWAVREYRSTIDDQQIASHESILSRVYLASLLYDYEKFDEAADVLEPLVKAVQGEGRVGQLYAELLRYYRDRLTLPEADTLAARFHFYRALQHREAADPQRQRQELELAIKFDPTDADVLIAMFHASKDDASWRAAVVKRIEELCRQFQVVINENPTDPTSYNQWAWLVGNTQGDFQQAIRYSHRSLELIPPGTGNSSQASFLDTLGRCYYAAGDYENALKYQRQAIEKLDYLQVMHRQLALFERTLAEQQATSPHSQEN